MEGIGGSVTQSTGSIKIEIEDPSFNMTTVATHSVPQSSSWANLNWQKYSPHTSVFLITSNSIKISKNCV